MYEPICIINESRLFLVSSFHLSHHEVLLVCAAQRSRNHVKMIIHEETQRTSVVL